MRGADGLVRHAWAVLLILAAMLGPARAEKVDVSVRIQERQASGLPWRGTAMPNLMHGPLMFGQLHSTAPSPILCLVRVSAQAVCFNVGQRGVQSPCPLSFDCEFESVDLPREPVFGLLLLSQGMVNRAMVDGLVLTRGRRSRTDAEVEAIDQRLRELAAQIAPPDRTEAQRRTRRFAIREVAECVDGCVLQQSRLTLTPAH